MGPYDLSVADWKEIESLKIASGEKWHDNLSVVVRVLKAVGPVSCHVCPGAAKKPAKINGFLV